VKVCIGIEKTFNEQMREPIDVKQNKECVWAVPFRKERTKEERNKRRRRVKELNGGNRYERKKVRGGER
jgi:hypothetical protein